MASDALARATGLIASANSALALTRTASIDLFAGLGALTIDPAVTMIRSAGYAVTGTGGGTYVADVLATPALAAAYPALCRTTANGRCFRFVENEITPEHAGALGAAGKNDQAAFQQIANYCAAVGITRFRLTKAYYEIWAPIIPPTTTQPYAPACEPFVVTSELHILGRPQRTTVAFMNSVGGTNNIATQTYNNGGTATTWRGSGIFLWAPNGTAPYPGYTAGAGIAAFTIENLILDGTKDVVGTSPVYPNASADLTHKGVHIQDAYAGTLGKFVARNCWARRFGGEIFYLCAVSTNAVYVEDIELSESNQSCWNPSTPTPGGLVAVGLNCHDAYLPTEILGGYHTYIGGKFWNGSNSGAFGVGAPPPANSGYWYPARDTTKAPPWITFIGTQFSKINSIQLNNYCRGSIITLDTPLYMGGWCTTDMDLTVEAWCDQVANYTAVTIQGPVNTTTPVGTSGLYYTKTANTKIALRCKRTQTAIAAGHIISGFTFQGLIDQNTVLLSVEGDVNLAFSYTGTPVTGYAQPLVTVGPIKPLGQPGGGTYVYPSAGTTALDILYPAYQVMPLSAGTYAFTLNANYTYADGQEVLFLLGSHAPASVVVFASGGAGLALQRDRKLYNQGDFMRLKYSVSAGKWVEQQYSSSQQLAFTGTLTVTPASLAAGAQASLGIVAISGVALGDEVTSVADATAATGGVRLWGEVSAANTVTVYALNNSGAAWNPGATTFNLRIEKA